MKYLLTFTVKSANSTLAQDMNDVFNHVDQPIHHGFSTLRSMRNFLKYYKGQYRDVIKWRISS